MSTQYQSFNQDGLELVINAETGQAYASQSASARMLGISESTLRDQITSRKVEVKTAETPTARGLKTSRLVSAQDIFKLALKYNTDLAYQMGSAGATVYLYGLAGYQVKPQLAQVDSPPRQLPPVRDTIEYMEISERWGLDSDPLIKSLISQRLAEELGGKVLAPATQVILTVRAAELGYDSRSIGNGSQLGKFVSKMVAPNGKTQHGRYPVNVYDLTPELDDCIHAYFR